MPVTVGIARTRTLAKLISDTAKPFGALAVLDRDAERRSAGRPAGHGDHRHRRPARAHGWHLGASAPASTWPGPTAGSSAAC